MAGEALMRGRLKHSRGWRWLVAVLLVTVAAGMGAGCATRADHESDLPWNVQQPWEGAPSIPGMTY